MSARPLELPPRRSCVTESWRPTVGAVEHQLAITFGFAPDGRLREAFCSAHKEGGHMQAVVQDGCIAISHCLQRGSTIFDLARAFGEDRAEGAAAGRPASIMGAIARKGCEIVTGRPYICPRTEDVCGAMRGRTCECKIRGIAR